MQHPLLKVLEGEGLPRSGVEVLEELVELIDRRLPDIALNDPVRPHLERFRAAAAPLPRVLRLAQP